jgi:hypothetical protein
VLQRRKGKEAEEHSPCERSSSSRARPTFAGGVSTRTATAAAVAARVAANAESELPRKVGSIAYPCVAAVLTEIETYVTPVLIKKYSDAQARPEGARCDRHDVRA